MKNLRTLAVAALLSAAHLTAAHPGALDTAGMNAAQKARVAAHHAQMQAHIATLGGVAATAEQQQSEVVLDDATLFNGTLADNHGVLEGNAGAGNAPVLGQLQAWKRAVPKAVAVDALHTDADAVITALRGADELATLAAVRGSAITDRTLIVAATAKFGAPFLALSRPLASDAAAKAAMIPYLTEIVQHKAVPMILAHFNNVTVANLEVNLRHGAGATAIVDAGGHFVPARLQAEIVAKLGAIGDASFAAVKGAGVDYGTISALSRRLIGAALRELAYDWTATARAAAGADVELVQVNAIRNGFAVDGEAADLAVNDPIDNEAFAREVLTATAAIQF